MSTESELHNRLAGEIVKAIVKPPLEAGSEFSAVLVVLESVVLGVMLMAKAHGYQAEPVLDSLVEAVKRRMAEQRLNDIPAAGHA